MNAGPMQLVKFVCVATAHADSRSEAALTIHDGVWAFCPKGGTLQGHDWRPSDGLPIVDALRFTPREPAGPASAAPARPAKPATPAPDRHRRS